MGNVTPLFTDEFADLPLKRALAQVLKRRDGGAKVVGAYCSYAPVELVWAMGGVPLSSALSPTPPFPRRKRRFRRTFVRSSSPAMVSSS
jgi:benzoyl-CoA reductase/2-hydroxyglutaryl-CoA dehydratase subunit BcrC/BadD/HgdB